MFSLEYSPSPRFVIRRSFPFSATSTMVFAAGRTFEKEKKKETEKFITIKTNIFAIPQSA